MPPLLQGASGGANTDIEQELMFAGREEGKLLPFVIGKPNQSSLCRVRNVRRLSWRITTVFTSTLSMLDGPSRLVNVQPSLGKETHGKCLLLFVVAMIRFL
jgi:hypothetical protein